MKLISKTRIGGRIQKKYDNPKTPAQRLIDSTALKTFQVTYLQEQIRSRNPIWLKQQLDIKLKVFFELVEERKVTSKAVS